jgi:hypothetical protein
MKVAVDVKRAAQEWDLTTGKMQNFLVIELFGIETKVPCTDEQLTYALRQLVAFAKTIPAAPQPTQAVAPQNDRGITTQDDQSYAPRITEYRYGPGLAPESTDQPETALQGLFSTESEPDATTPVPAPVRERQPLRPVSRRRVSLPGEGDDAGFQQG